MSTSEHDRHIFWQAVVVLTILSASGSLFIILSILLKYRKDFSSRLVLYLSVADFWLSAVCLCLCAYNLSNGHVQPNSSFACQIQPVVTWYFMEVSMLWLAVIAINSCKVMHTQQALSYGQEWTANLVCWGLPLITATLPLGSTAGRYGNRNGLWCSFAENQKMVQLTNVLIYYIPCCIIIVISYGLIAYKLRYLGKWEVTGSSDSEKLAAIKRLFMFVLCYFVVWTPLVVCYIYEATSDKFVPFWVEFVSDNMLHVQGLLNFIMYGLTSSLIRKLKNKLGSLSSSFALEEESRSKDSNNIATIAKVHSNP